MASSQAFKLKPMEDYLTNNKSLSSPFYSSKKLSLLYFIELFLGVTSTIFAIYFNRLQCDWLCFQTDAQFAAICVYIFLSPLGFMFIIDSISKIAASKSIHIVLKCTTLTLLALSCIFIPTFLFLPSQWNGSLYFKLSHTPPSSQHMNIYILSFQLFVLWPPFGFVFLLIAYRLLKNHRRKRQNRQLTPRKNNIQRKQNLYTSQQDAADMDIKDINSSNDSFKSMSSATSLSIQPLVGTASLLVPIKPFQCTTNCIYVALFIFIIIPLMWLTTALLPSGYDKFELAVDLQHKSASKWNINVHIHDMYLHVYTDVLIYYIGILFTFLIGFVLQQYKNSRKILRRFVFSFVFRFCRNERILSLTVGQFLVLLIWIPIIMTVFLYFAFIHNFGIGADQKLNPFSVEKFVRSCGIMSTIFCGLCLIPVCRSSVILKYCFGLTFESAMKYHRFLGMLMVLFACIHFIGFLLLLIGNNYYGAIHIFSQQMPFSNASIYHGDNWTISLMQVIVLFVFLPFIVTFSSKIRRKCWEIFYFVHIYGTMVIVIGLLYHASQAWYFMLPGLVLQFYERLCRLYACSRTNVQILSLKALAVSDIVRLRLNICNHHPMTTLCSYYFLNIPHIAPFEWHPFSVMNVLNSGYSEFYIKNMGGFSSKLLQLTYANRKLFNKMDILIEGPFGCDVDYHSYHRLILIAGGIGITPLHCLFFTLYNEALIANRQHNNDEMYMNELPSITLIWIVRYADMFEIYKKSFRKFKRFEKQLSNMKISLYATREEVRYPATMHCVDRYNLYNNNRIVEEDEEEEEDGSDYEDDALHISQSGQSQSSNTKFGLQSLHSSIKDARDKKNKNLSQKGASNRKGIRTVECPIKWEIGRPDLFQELRYLDRLKSKAMIYVCGPSELVKTCKELAHLYGNHFKKESFIF